MNRVRISEPLISNKIELDKKFLFSSCIKNRNSFVIEYGSVSKGLDIFNGTFSFFQNLSVIRNSITYKAVNEMRDR
jgi:hypothetical protein